MERIDGKERKPLINQGIVTDSDTVADRTTERIYRTRTEIMEEAENGRI